MQYPFFSIIVPCYNQAQYLEEAINSVLAQTYTNWECIIVNDGSPDNTDEIASILTKKDIRIKYFKKKNGGISDARNFGIERSKSEWILPLDADDKINNNYLKLAANAIKNDPQLSLIYCKAENFGDFGGVFYLDDYSFKGLLRSNLIFCTTFFKKQSWIKAKGYDIELKKGKEDWEFWVNILDEQSKVLRLDYLGFYYRRKKISRDVLFNQDKNFLVDLEEYVYEKHRYKYIQQFGTPQRSLLRIKALENILDNKNELQNKIHKNIITRILYKIIKIIV